MYKTSEVQEQISNFRLPKTSFDIRSLKASLKYTTVQKPESFFSRFQCSVITKPAGSINTEV
jgi:hypothetical protein